MVTSQNRAGEYRSGQVLLNRCLDALSRRAILNSSSALSLLPQPSPSNFSIKVDLTMTVLLNCEFHGIGVAPRPARFAPSARTSRDATARGRRHPVQPAGGRPLDGPFRRISL